MIHHRSCPICEAMCGLEIVSDGKKIVSIRGDKKDPLSKGYICPKAISIQDLYTDPDRLTRPVKRSGGQWREIGWTEAFDEIETRLKHIQKRYGRDAVAVYFGNPNAHYHGNVLFLSYLFKALRTRHRFSSNSLDQWPLMMASYLMLGHQFLFPVPDIDRTDCFLIIGANPVVSGGSIMTTPGSGSRIKKIRKRGGKVFVVDPAFTKTASLANRHYFIRPGTDALLLLALLNTVFAEKLAGPGRLEPMLKGLAEIRAAVSEYTPDSVAGITGIAADDIRQLAREFCAAPSAVCYGRMGASVQEFGTLATWLILVFNTVTGKMDQPGGMMFPSPVLDLAAMTALLNEKGSIGPKKTKVRGIPSFGGEFPSATMAEEMLAGGEGGIRSLVCLAGNPALSSPNSLMMEQALQQLDFMVAMDWYITETSRHADIILPPSHMPEHDHFPVLANFVGIRQVAKYSPPVFLPDKASRHSWQILKEMTLRFTSNPLKRALFTLATPERLLRLGLRFGPHGARFSPAGSGLTLAKLRRWPHGMDLGPMAPSLPDRLFTKDKKIHLAPGPFVKELNRLKNLDWQPGPLPDGRFDLVLVGRRHLMSNNSWFHNFERMHNKTNRCTARMHPEDAATRGISTGDWIKVSSLSGQIELEAEVSDTIMAGSISIPHGWGHTRPGVCLRVATKYPGVCVNDIVDNERLETLCGNAVFSGIRVSVEKAGNRNILEKPCQVGV